MSEGKNTNLLKVAKELNIGLSTAVDFLEKSGFSVEARPNTKLNDEMYDVLLREFQGDKIAKEESKQIVIGKFRRDEAPAPIVEIADHQMIKTTTDAATLVENIPPPLIISTITIPDHPIKEEIEKISVEQPAEEHYKIENILLPGVKMIRKIDLSELNLKTRPTKKPTLKSESKSDVEAPMIDQEIIIPPPAAIVEKEPSNTSKQENEQMKEEIIPELPISIPVEPLPKPEDDVIRAKANRLAGPNVVGRIELPVKLAPKSRPVASSSNLTGPDQRRKRKRTNQDGTDRPHTGTTPQRTVMPAHGAAHPDFRNRGNSFLNSRGPANPSRPDFRNKTRAPEGPKVEPTDKEIQDQIKATLARLSGAGKSGKFAQRAKLRRQKRDDVANTAEQVAIEHELQSKILKVTEFVTANELASMLDVSVTQVISTCMSLGMFVSINQRLDAEALAIVADEFGYEITFVKPEDEEKAALEEVDAPEDMLPRAPIVTVMGHVDHGKTSLLDFLRKTNVIAGESGGITQHIGAYEVTLENGRKITFLDTPGHEAFTAMRARGAKVTDIAIIVIAADDSVMPQTKEAINHAQAAGVPIVFAFSKIDKAGANTDKIREQLSAMNILVEEWGGKYQSQEISGKTGSGINVLLEKVLLEAELLDLKANPNKRATGTIIESALDKGRGIVTTVLIQAGTLRVGDPILAGCYSGKVKALNNERGQKIDYADPSTPVQVLGMQGSPTSGDRFNALSSEVEAREIANKRLQLQREQGLRTQKHITLDEIGRRLAIGSFKELNIIVKGDVDGSIEALSDSLLKLSTEKIQVNIIHKSVGQISESDVLLASASDAIIIGFQVRPSPNARKLAEKEQIDIRFYAIIYDAINEVKAAMEGMLAPEFEEKIVSNVEIREVFKITRVGTIAGCMVLDGKITRNSKVRIIRAGVVIYSGELASLKRFKDDVKEVSSGYECGLNIHNFNNIEVGDIVESYEQVEIRKL